MRTIFGFIAAILIASSVFAQSPERISYQAVMRDGGNNLLQSQSVGVKVTILQGSAVGVVVYSEIFNPNPQTNSNGLLTLEIGAGIPLSGLFSAIDWSNGPYFIQSEIDPSGGTSYSITGVSQLLSVPYALYAEHAGTIDESDPFYQSSVAAAILASDTALWNHKLDLEVDGDITNELQVISIGHDTIFLSDGGYAKLPSGFDGDYLSLINRPDFTNWDTDESNDFDGQYSSLTGTPTNVSIFFNDAGYLTSFAEVDGSIVNELQVLSISNDTIFLSDGGFVKLPVGFDGDYNHLSNIPDFSTYDIEGGNDWNFEGNAGTNAGTDFLGTTDNQDFVIKTNNIEHLRVTTRGHLEVRNTGNSVFIGALAGLNDDHTDNKNIGIGNISLGDNVSGFCNVANGYMSLAYNTTGSKNVAVGSYSMLSNSSGVENVAVGYQSLAVNSIGGSNVAVGSSAMYMNGDGFANVAIGQEALLLNEGGSYNVAVGDSALYTNFVSGNTAVGSKALYSNFSGVNNIAVGFNALYFNIYGESNTAVGSKSLFNNTKGNHNIALGNCAMTNNTYGGFGIAIGDSALFTQSFTNADHSWVSNNIAIGHSALFSNQPSLESEGISNVAIGNSSLLKNTTGDANSALGQEALKKNTIGSLNTAIGAYSLYENVSGGYNTAIGYAAGAFANYNNISAIGYFASPTASNMIHLGNSSITWIGGQVNWSTYSDERIKKNINENVKGLDFILKLRPVTYNIDKTVQDGILGVNDSSSYKEKYDIEKITQSGFIAQEVELAATESGYDFSGVHKPAGDTQLYSLSYAEFVVPLVKATQEQQVIIEKQQLVIQNLEKVNVEQQAVIEDLIRRIEALEKDFE